MARLLTALLFVVFLAQNALAGPLLVAAGAGYKKLVDDVAQAYEAKTGAKVELLYGNMGQIMGQVKAGGGIDVILGDKSFLASSGVPFDSFLEVGKGRLVVAYAKGVGLAAPTDIVKPEIKKLAMPDPAKAIYGKAASEFLDKSGLAAQVKEKLLVVGTVPQVTAYLVSGEVDAGFINVTDAMGVQDKIGGMLDVDQSLYSPILIVAGVLTESKGKPEVAAFAAFLASDEVRKLSAAHGL
ncbi:molybdate ABC transporter substrate-binding protein [Desulfolutivibrio sulfoxidireducens]|uniref:molybdate ABC transporter substrate-binding protein n=1 Tax=Desulfolutivibrio sulfoxidireducens TaxID=2773299 RepID=UPI00159EA3A4|nr:molybdate ABC transporter substrate-binding protein [Desulfolutivibrio sulfoxidireducens]QLA16201.1 molybdate ABC transporter substrate-binding protein [Desulfolutivibrio sulfoxidireducens]QLA19901.1 molybdate ABC transporter substrate-binding protein [Desulfolutivibrio sulfoxidireducens]